MEIIELFTKLRIANLFPRDKERSFSKDSEHAGDGMERRLDTEYPVTMRQLQLLF